MINFIFAELLLGACINANYALICIYGQDNDVMLQECKIPSPDGKQAACYTVMCNSWGRQIQVRGCAYQQPRAWDNCEEGNVVLRNIMGICSLHTKDPASKIDLNDTDNACRQCAQNKCMLNDGEPEPTFPPSIFDLDPSPTPPSDTPSDADTCNNYMQLLLLLGTLTAGMIIVALMALFSLN